ncbi:hypothetical protein CON36_35625 [Bacillus cereus]|uniref:Uncharacterized protein n=2 Tax=Bacillus cereus group TaxID=86661 RepID=A0A9X6SRY4_BACCE|nr:MULTISPECIES: hypothetical protein [Bacillus cereus group]PDZ94093.1 hypothetical protein CON36_35625 [Bacillus cereus]PFJ25156.1 hypothetical protein COJ15_35845 [Bacillus thuringiensis]
MSTDENKFEENEEAKEDAELSERFGSRTDLPEDQWITRDPKKPFIEWYEERKRERLNKK